MNPHTFRATIVTDADGATWVIWWSPWGKTRCMQTRLIG